jgi:hypothetical protein
VLTVRRSRGADFLDSGLCIARTGGMGWWLQTCMSVQQPSLVGVVIGKWGGPESHEVLPHLQGVHVLALPHHPSQQNDALDDRRRLRALAVISVCVNRLRLHSFAASGGPPLQGTISNVPSAPTWSGHRRGDTLSRSVKQRLKWAVEANHARDSSESHLLSDSHSVVCWLSCGLTW